MSEFSKVTGYKVKNRWHFLYTNNEVSKREIKKKMAYTIATTK